MQRVQVVRLYADEAGESHFQDMDVTLLPTNFAPPAPPLNVAHLGSATQCDLGSASADWDGAVPHPSPRRQFLIVCAGATEVTASDGEVRRFTPGSILLVEDTHGKGHCSRAVGPDDVLDFSVALAD